VLAAPFAAGMELSGMEWSGQACTQHGAKHAAWSKAWSKAWSMEQGMEHDSSVLVKHQCSSVQKEE